MKKSIFSILLLLFLFVPFSSNSQLPDTNWVQLMSDPNSNFYDIQAKFNEYWDGKEIVKGRGYKQFKRWESYMAPRVYPSGDITLPSQTYANYEAWLATYQGSPSPGIAPGGNGGGSGGGSTMSVSGNWVLMGPTGAPTGGGAGRLNFIRFDPLTPTTMYVGSPGGGLWKTTNGGTSWSTNTDQLAIIGCTDIAIHPTVTTTMYLATGDGDAGDTYSIGVLKSIDGGLTWNTTGLTFPVTSGVTISRLLINPTNPNIIMSFGNNGIWRSIDAGVTWTQPATSFNGIKDAEFKPGDPNTVYAAGTTFRRSTDGGATWSGSIATGLTNIQRLSIAVTPANTAYVYVLASRTTDDGFNAVIRSTNSGTSFTTRMAANATNNILGWDDGTDAGGQGWYDLTIAASPTNAEEVFTGGVNMWRSTNGGTSFTLNSHWYGGFSKPYVHADIHDIVFLPGSGTTVYSGNDGGIFRTTNSGTAWTDISTNLAIAQQYRIGLSASNATLLLAGHQDNGTNRLNGATWSQVVGGDGMDCFVDRTNNNVMYASLYYGAHRRSTNGGAAWTNIVTGIPNGTGATDWVSAWHQDPVTANTLYAGGRPALYRTTNQGTNWSALGTPTGTGNITEFVIAPSNNQIIYCIKSGTNAVSRSTNGGTSFTAVSTGLPTTVAPTSITVSNVDPNIVFVTYSGYSATNKVFRSTNGGTSWTNISTGLPNIPVNTVVFANGTPNDPIYVGTDVGVYYRDNTTGWIMFNTGLPNVAVRDLEIYYPTSRLRAATFGRGTWESDMVTVGAYPPLAEFSAAQTVCTGNSVAFTDLSTFAPTSWSWTFAGGTPATSTLQNPVITYNTPGVYNVTLVATNANGSDTEIKTGYITVVSGSGTALPITEGFVGVTFPPAGWTLNNGGNPITWIRSGTVGNAPTAGNSTQIDNYTTNTTGDLDDLAMIPADFSGLSSAQLQFDVAYARYDATYYDQLDVLVSSDCGQTYTVVYSKAGTVLATDPDQTAAYTAPATWRTETINLNAYVGNPRVQILLRSVSGYGQYLYLDNINLTGVGATPTANFTALPNPACVGQTVTFTNTSVGATTWSWNFGAGATPATATGVGPHNVVYSTSGTKNVSLTINGGVSTSNQTVTINANPSAPTISASGPTTFCAGGSVTLTSSQATGNVWSTGATTQSINVTTSGSYTVTYTNGSGCSATSTATVVTVNANPSAPTISASGPLTFCTGGSVTLTSSQATGNVWSTGATTQSINVTASGSYTVTYTNGSGCSATSTASVVTVNANPSAPTISASGPLTFCTGGSVTLTSSQATGNLWSTGATTQSINVTASGSYTVTYTNGSGCSATSTATVVTVNANPSAPTISASGPTTFCTGGSVTLTSSQATGNVWSTGGTTQSINVSASGSYTVTYTNGSGCSATSTATVVTVNANPSAPTISASGPLTFCAGGSVTLTSSQATGNVWSTGATTQSINVTASGSYSVTYTNGSGCSATSTATAVTVNANPSAPTISASGPLTFCAGGSVTLTSSQATGNVWSTGATTQSINVTASGSYTVTYTNGSGCSATSTATVVNVNANPSAPTISASGPLTFCTGSSVTLTSSQATGNVWSTGATTQSINVTASGSYTVTYTNGGGCSATSTASVVTVNANPSAPTISASGPLTFCAGGSVTLTSSQATGNLWSTGATTQSISVTASGSYTVTYTNGSGCSATSTATVVTVNANPSAPTISASGPTTFCTGGSVTLTSSQPSGNLWSTGSTSSSIIVSTSGSYTVTYTNGSGCSATSSATVVTVVTTPTIAVGTIVNPSICASATGSIQITGSGTGVVNWTGTATGNSGTITLPYTISGLTAGAYSISFSNGTCVSNVVNQSLTDPTPPATPTISASGPTTFCVGGSVTLTSSYATGNVWSTGATTQSINVTANGTYTVTYTNGGGCSASSAPVVVTVNSNPSAPVISAGGPTTFCAGGSVTLTSSQGTGNVWSTGATTQSINVSAAGSYTVTYTNGSGCSATSTATVVTVNANPSAPTISASGSTTFCTGGSVTLTSSQATGNLWSTGATTQSINVTASGSYTVTYTNGSGCSTTSAATMVTVNANPTAPTISASGPTSFCSGGSVTLTSSQATGNLWSTGATTQSINVSAAGSYTVTYTNGSGCSATSAATVVTVNAIPSIAIGTVTNPTICATATGSIQVTGSGTGTVSWTGTVAGSSGSVTLPYTISGLGTGTYNITFSNGLCTSNLVSQSLSDPSAPGIPVITASGSTSLCPGNSVTLTSSYGTGNLWSTGATTASINVSLAGSYTVTYTDGSGCSATSTVTVVTVNANPSAPTITASGSTTFCAGGSVTLTSSQATGNVWSTGATTQSINVASAGSYTVTYTNGSGCSATSAATIVTVNVNSSVPTITPSGSTTFCAGGSVDLTASQPSGLVWSTSATTQTITAITAGTYTVTYTDGNGCSATSSPTTITVNANPSNPVITPNGPTTFCAGGSVDLISSQASGNLWSTLATSSSINVTSSGAYSVTYTDGNGCSATSVPITVMVNAQPAAPLVTASGPTTFCGGGNVSLTSSYVSGNLWSTSETVQSIVVSASGSYLVTYSDGNGCSATSIPTVVTVYASPATPSITANGPTVFCEGDSVELVGSQSSGILWSNSAVTPSIWVYNSGNYYVTYTDGNGCSSTSSTLGVTVNATPSVNLGAFSSVCSYVSPFSLMGGTPAGGTYSGPGVSSGLFDPALAGVGVHTITYTYIDGNGCSNSAQSTLDVKDCAGMDELDMLGIEMYPNPSFGEITIQAGDELIEQVRILDAAGRLVYDHLSNETKLTIDLSAISAGMYMVEITTANGSARTQLMKQ